MLREFASFGSRRRSVGVASGAEDYEETSLLLGAFEASLQGWFWSVDPEGRLTYISKSVADLLERTPDQLLGMSFAGLFEQADDDQSGRRTLPFVLSRRLPFEKIILRPAAGTMARQWAVSGAPQFANGHFSGYRGVAIDVTEQRRSSEDASRLAQYDALTALPNRRRMAEVLEERLRELSHRQRSCAVMLVDLDRFKQVNDTLGHPAGDALLTQVADRLVRIVGDREQVFRLGGDEFQVILPDCGDNRVIEPLAERIITSLSQPYSVEGSRCSIGASIGIAVAPGDGRTRVDLIRNADLALYAAKTDGRGRATFFSEDLLLAAEARRGLEEDLRDALARDQISLAYQPIVDSRTNQMTGVEALLRWQHPVNGPISPAVFIPIAEEAGLVAQLGDWALRQACQDAASWPGTLRVAVNVSPVQFNDGALPSHVMSALASAGLSPERLELEITEGVFLGDTPAADAMFASLKRIGVRLALDDFGTGYSSLGYLRTAPFDKIKIDQSFVREATLPGSRNAAIIAAIVALAEALGMDTTAEGIEYMDQLALIRALRVSHVQGWVYSKALSSAELGERLADGKWGIDPSGPATQRSNRQSVYRKIGIIHQNRYRSTVVRNLSESGALIDRLDDLQASTAIVVDFGEGQLTLARVVRSAGRQLGIEFEQPLLEDETGGLRTARRISPYQLATLGLPNPGEPDKLLGDHGEPWSAEAFAEKLSISAPQRSLPPQPRQSLTWSSPPATGSLTVEALAARYLDSLREDEQALATAQEDLRTSLLPQLGHLPLSQVSASDVREWLTLLSERDRSPGGLDSRRLQKLLSRMWSLAVDLQLTDGATNPVEQALGAQWREQQDALLSIADASELLGAARSSPNRQLRFIIALLMLTGARTRDVLNLQWSQLDLEGALWRVKQPGGAATRELALNQPALDLLKRLPQIADCPFALPNPTTRKPYRSLTQSWEVVKARAGLPHLELDDLRYSRFAVATWREQLDAFVQQDSDDTL
ncbi:EAL domain-containing protein [Sphingomonas sp. KRR8]|uniref:EAL domain-containing protein n=1 Tax=Sphingomonas sp. KRR8 TaxID=2942996 RepID=UPI002020E751|nr:EAL domain-containing protein [Sphingomonas sp. KRR8]URD60409.1 EAL domain-containing protein [Sphingomonas sp. KRR8]